MTTFQTDNQVIYFSKEFGLITDNQVILTNGTKQNKIDFESINKVNLIKHRVFYLNSLMFLLSAAGFAYSYFYYESEEIEMHVTIIITGLLLLITSLIYKFYTYKIVIKEKNNSVIEVKTTQIHRESIKEFYNAIVKRIPKRGKNN